MIHLSEVADLIFVMALAHAFYLQRRVFSQASRNKKDATSDIEAEHHDAVPLADAVDVPMPPDTADKGDVSRDAEWARLTGRHAADDAGKRA